MAQHVRSRVPPAKDRQRTAPSAAHGAAASRAGMRALCPRDVLALQRSAGNAATAAALQRLSMRGSLAVQRLDEEDLDAYKEATAIGVETSGTMSEAGELGFQHKLGEWYRHGEVGDKPEDSGKHLHADLPMGFAVSSEVLSDVGVGLGIRKWFKSSKEAKEHGKAGRIGARRGASRERSGARGDVTSAGLGTVSSGGEIGSSAYEIKAAALEATSPALEGAEHAAHIAGAVGHGVALPLSIFNMTRWARKTDFARQRWNRLEALKNDWDAPAKEALASVTSAYDAAVEAQKAGSKAVDNAQRQHDQEVPRLDGMIAAIDEANDKKTAQKDLREKSGDRAAVAAIALEIGAINARRGPLVAQRQALVDGLAQARNALTACTQRVADARALKLQKEQIRDNARQQADTLKAKIGKEWATGTEKTASVEEIHAYALMKNRRGFFKKLTTTLGAATGTAAGVAALVVASVVAAGVGAALMATPVGWALAAAAALVTLGMVMWKLGSMFKKRFQFFKHQNQGITTTRALLMAFNPKNKVTSKRKEYATRLFEVAKGGPAIASEETTRARQLVNTLVEKGSGVLSFRKKRGTKLFDDNYWNTWDVTFKRESAKEREGVIDLLYDKLAS